MTREQWQKMYDDEKIRKIAELCGWKRDIRNVGPKASKAPCWLNPKTGEYVLEMLGHTQFPDYLHDLNAMHEAEMDIFNGTSGWRIEDDYLRHLSTAIGIPVDKDEAVSPYICSATASQRAEAFVMTMRGEP